MRKILITVVIVASFLSASCYWAPEAETGSVSFQLHPDVVSRALINSYDTMRVYLLSDSQSLLQHDDGYYYQEFDLNETETVEVEGVPPGTWDVLVSLGTATDDGYLVVEEYGSADGIEVTAGGPGHEASVTLAPSPLVISESLLGSDATGAAFVGTDVYASVGNTVYVGSGPASMGTTLPALAAGYTLNGITEGSFFVDGDNFAKELWLNTSKRIVPYRGSSFVYDFQSLEINVTEAAVFEDDDEPDALTIVFQRPKGFGGVVIGDTEYPDPSLWDWVDVNQLEDSLSSELILDFTLSDNYAYFATTLGAFWMPRIAFEDGTADDFIADGTFFTVDSGADIYSLQYNPATQKLLIGTADGVYRVSRSGDGEPLTAGAAPVSGSGLTTEGYGFTMTSVNTSGDYAVFVSSYDLFIYNTATGALTMLPFYAGLPGLLTDFAWNGNTLFLSGTGTDADGDPTPLGVGGFVSLDIAALF